jgi:hypothetical protein
MAIETLVDITKCGIGAVAVGGATQVTIGDESRRVRTGDSGGLTRAVDTVLTEIKASIQAQDPLAVPLVLALSGAQSIVVGGRLVNAGTYRDYTMDTSVLTGFGLEIADGQPGTCNFDLQNRAAADSDALSDELAVAAGTLQAIRTRANLIRILATAAFTDDASTALTLAGIERFSYRATPEFVHVASSNQAAQNAWNLADQVDVSPYWQISGSLTLRDTTIASAQAVGQQLVALRRGTLVLPCQVSGFDSGASAPADSTVTFQRIKFHSCRTSLRSKAAGAQDIGFDAVQVSAANAIVAIASMITVA